MLVLCITLVLCPQSIPTLLEMGTSGFQQATEVDVDRGDSSDTIVDCPEDAETAFQHEAFGMPAGGAARCRACLL